MAKQITIVCDWPDCGKSPAESYRITGGGKTWNADYCGEHIGEAAGATRSKPRGRPRKTAATLPKSTGTAVNGASESTGTAAEPSKSA